MKIQKRHRASLLKVKRFSNGHNLRLNVGCGSNVKQGWINIDVYEQSADLQLDVREPLPFSDGSVSIIYSEHFFEHLDYPGFATAFLRESLRILQPGGVFSVGVPDSESALIAYASGESEWFTVVRQRWHPRWCDTRMHNINYLFRQQGDHKYAYDLETVTKILEATGFDTVTKRAFNPDLDSREREWGTLYVDAQKPNGKTVSK